MNEQQRRDQKRGDKGGWPHQRHLSDALQKVASPPHSLLVGTPPVEAGLVNYSTACYSIRHRNINPGEIATPPTLVSVNATPAFWDYFTEIEISTKNPRPLNILLIIVYSNMKITTIYQGCVDQAVRIFSVKNSGRGGWVRVFVCFQDRSTHHIWKLTCVLFVCFARLYNGKKVSVPTVVWPRTPGCLGAFLRHFTETMWSWCLGEMGLNSSRLSGWVENFSSSFLLRHKTIVTHSATSFYLCETIT